MAKFWLINSVNVAGVRQLPGDSVDDVVDPVATFRAAGALLWPQGDPIVDAAALTAQSAHKNRGASEAELESIMQSAVQAAQISQSSASTVSRWFIDETNGAEANSGKSQPSPKKTVMGGIVEEWGTNKPTLNQPTIIKFAPSEANFNDDIRLEPVINYFGLYLVGTPTDVISDVISAFTPINRNPPTPNNNRIAGTAITVFEPYKGMRARAALQTRSTRGFGATPPAVTLTGTPLLPCEPIQVFITSAGALGVATFSWFLNGVLQETGVLTAAAVPLVSPTLGATGITANFPAGTYNTAHTWRQYSHAYFWFINSNGNMNPGTNPIGATSDITYPMGWDAPYNPHSDIVMQSQLVTTTAYGTAPPAATLTGIPQAHYMYLQVEITTAGAVGVAEFRWSINGVLQASNVLTAAAVTLGTTGLVINFPVGAYSTDNVYQATSEDYGANMDFTGAEKQLLTVGDSFTVQQLPKIFASVLEPEVGCGLRFGFLEGAIIVQDLWLATPKTPAYGSPLAPHTLRYGNTCFYQSRTDCQLYRMSSQMFAISRNCAHVAGFFTGQHTFYAGFTGPHGNAQTQATPGAFFGVTYDADHVMFFSPGCFYATQVGSMYLPNSQARLRGPGGAMYITPSGRGIQYSATAPLGATALWAGTGQTGVSIRTGGALRIVNLLGVTAANALLLSGTTTVVIDGVSSGAAGPANPLSSYDPATGLWVGGKATVPLAVLTADLDAGAPASGNQYAIQNPHSGSRVTMSGNAQFN